MMIRCKEPLPNLIDERKEWSIIATLLDNEGYTAEISIPSSMVYELPIPSLLAPYNANILCDILNFSFLPEAWESLASVNHAVLSYDVDKSLLTVKYTEEESGDTYTRVYGIEETKDIDGADELLRIIIAVAVVTP